MPVNCAIPFTCSTSKIHNPTKGTANTQLIAMAKLKTWKRWSKINLFCICKILGRTIHKWVEEEKLHSITYSVGGNIWHHRKISRLCENSTVNQNLYRWFLQNCSEKMCINGVLLKVKVVKYNKQLIRNKQLYSSWTVDLVVEGEMRDTELVLQVDLHLVTVKQLKFYTKWWWCWWYTDEQEYNTFETWWHTRRNQIWSFSETDESI